MTFIDVKKKQRQKVYEEYVLPYWDGKCGERIKNDILEAMYQEKVSPVGQMPKIVKRPLTKPLSPYRSARLDVFDEGAADNMVFFYGNDFQLSYPMWFNNPGWRKGGVGAVVEFVCGWFWRKYKIELIPNNSGKLILQFKSTNPEKQKLWRCYKQVSFNRRKIRKKTICTWHDSPFVFETAVKAGERYKLAFKVRRGTIFDKLKMWLCRD